MGKFVLSIGSNYGDKETEVTLAIEWLATLLRNFSKSNVYQTKPAGNASLPYVNAVVAGRFDKPLEELDSLLKQYERERGRTVAMKKEGKVPIDIDVVVVDDRVIREWDYQQSFFRKGASQIIEDLVGI